MEKLCMQTAFVEDLLFPELAKKHEHIAAKYARQKADKIERGELDALCEKQRRYYEANRERIRERKRQYYQRNKEEIAAKQKAYQEANRERRNEQQRHHRKALAALAAAAVL